MPDYCKEDLSYIFAEVETEELTEQDYRFLFMQTGLSESTVRNLVQEGEEEKLYRIQERFFTEVDFECTKNSIITWEEWTEAEEQEIEFAGLEAGDILITPCSHTLGWRNGHAALLVDAKEGITLEAVVLGQESSLQSLEKWAQYPSVTVYRLKGVSAKIRENIAAAAVERLLGIKYSIFEGILLPKYVQEGNEKTQCAHLVWAAYRYYGYDIDGDGGLIVTPKDISESPLLEVVQTVGNSF